MEIPISEMKMICDFAKDNNHLTLEAQKVMDFIDEIEKNIDFIDSPKEVELNKKAKEVEESWKRFLDIYPKRVPSGRRLHLEKEASKKEFVKLLKLYSEAQIIEAVEKMLAAKEKSDSLEYIAQVKSFLKKECEAYIEDPEESIAVTKKLTTSKNNIL